MKSERIQYYYNELKRYYLKSDSDWTDKAKSIRTVAHNFYNELTLRDGKFNDALNEFYQSNHQRVVRDLAFTLKDELNNIVHNNIAVEKERYLLFYNSLVRLIYLATNVLPDEATLDFIGLDRTDRLNELNDEKKDAVLCDDKVIYVTAGPGTGKTLLLIHKLFQYIYTSERKQSIVALSFTNTAANELGEKFYRKAFEIRMPEDKEYDFYNGTIHSFCFRMLKSFFASEGKAFNYIIIDDADIRDLAEEIGIQLNNNYTIEEIAECLRSKLKTKNPDLLSAVEEIKKRYSIISIDDILTMFIDYLDHNQDFVSWLTPQITVLVIDEAQDLNAVNYEIFLRLMNIIPDLNVFLVGDPKQNIFSFNGGSYTHLAKFLESVPEYTEKTLTVTYRCPQIIADYVNEFTFNDCPNLALRSECGREGIIVTKSFPDLRKEAEYVVGEILSKGPLTHSAVLCSNLKYLVTFIATLYGKKIPYKVFGGRRSVKPYVKLFNHILRIIASDNDYSVRWVGRHFKLGGSKKVFYNSEFGKRVLEIRHSMAASAATFKDVASEVVDLIDYQGTDESVLDDYKILLEISRHYDSVDDFLFAFATDKETFADFYQKDYAECPVPVEETFLTVSTIHSAKGLEWDNVFIMGMSDENFPNPYFAKDKAPAEKLEYFNDRLKQMYVAATRSKANLFLTYSQVGVRGYKQSKSRYLQYVPLSAPPVLNESGNV